MNRNYSGHLGGPIIKDRVWFYGGGNYDSRIQSNPGIDPRVFKQHDSHWYSHAVLEKVTWQINDALKVKQYLQSDIWGGQATPTLSRPFTTVTSNWGPSYTYAYELNATLSSNTLLTARAAGWWSVYPTRPLSGDYVTPIRNDALTGIASGGVPSFNKQSVGRHIPSVKVNHFIQTARMTHDLRAGVQIEWGRRDQYNTLPSGVNYSDLGGQPDQATFRDAFINGAASKAQGLWAEDQTTLGNRLTLSLGVRYDHMHAVSPDLPAVNNRLEPTGATIKGLGDMLNWNVVAPRVGFNLKLTEDGKTILRGSYGRGYNPMPLFDIASVHPGLSPITLARWNPATSSYSTTISVTDPLANIAFDKNMEPSFTDSYSVGVDRELRPNLGFTATVVHKRAENFIGWTDIGGVYGTRAEALPDGRTLTVYPLLSPTSTRKFRRTNGPGTFTRYSGLVLAVEKRWARRWQANVGYTFSKAEGLPETGQDPNDDINNGGRLSTDRPHMFLAGGMYEIPKIAVMVAGTFQLLKGAPFAPQALVQLPQGRRSINIEPADKYRLPLHKPLSFRISKILFRNAVRKIDAGAEIQNVLQDKAYNTILTRNLFASTFAQPASWIEPRRMDFVVRYFF